MGTPESPACTGSFGCPVHPGAPGLDLIRTADGRCFHCGGRWPEDCHCPEPPEEEWSEADAEQALRAWASVKRDELVRAAHAAGVSKSHIHAITGIARTTIDRILRTAP